VNNSRIGTACCPAWNSPADGNRRGLRRIAYDRVASVEIFRPNTGSWIRFKLARDACASLTQVLGQSVMR